jgi:imidazolonepropionase
MTRRIDLLVYNASQICTVPSIDGRPQRGEHLGTLGIIENGALAIDGGKILDVGTTANVRIQYEAQREINAGGCAIVPGLVDPHTHAVWVGDRAAEFEMRIAGATYMEIMAAGGGINSTVQQVRAASVEQLVAETRARLDRMLRLGTTTVEIKTGYGLNTAAELKQLEAIYRLIETHPMDIAVTFLGAHAVPPEYKGRTDAYVDLVVNEMIPAVIEFAGTHHLPFIDVFCEQDVFDLSQTRRILEAGRAQGMPLKVHADEFAGLGGTKLAVELGAASADHLVSTPLEDIQALGQGNTVAVALPGTPFGLAHEHYTPARDILKAGGILALATDCNPGTAWCESMAFIMALACRAMRLTPAEALAAATINAAYAIHKADRVGSLEIGKQADMLILSTTDYRHLAYRFGGSVVKSVIKKGMLIT